MMAQYKGHRVHDVIVHPDRGVQGQIYAISIQPDGYGETYAMYGIKWIDGLRTAMHEDNMPGKLTMESTE